jgi:hypothetical protein
MAIQRNVASLNKKKSACIVVGILLLMLACQYQWNAQETVVQDKLIEQRQLAEAFANAGKKDWNQLVEKQKLAIKNQLPKVHQLLEQKQNLRVLIIGDEYLAAKKTVAGEKDHYFIQYFLEELAKTYGITNEINITQQRGEWQHFEKKRGGEIQLRILPLSRNSITEVAAAIEIASIEEEIDLLIVTAGWSDAKKKLPLDAYERCVENILVEAQKKPCDMIWVEPFWFPLLNQTEDVWSKMVQYRQINRVKFEKKQVLLVSSDDWSQWLTVDIGNTSEENLFKQLKEKCALYGNQANDGMISPSEELMELQGRVIYEKMVDLPKNLLDEVTVQVTKKQEGITVKAESENRGVKYLIPLLNNHEDQIIRFTADQTSGELKISEPNSQYKNEDCFPFLYLSEKQCRLLDVPIKHQQVEVVWNNNVFRNMSFDIKDQLVIKNHRAQFVNLEVEVYLNEHQLLKEKVEVQGDDQEYLNIPIPFELIQQNKMGKLKLRVKEDGVWREKYKKITGIQNLAVGEKINLTSRGGEKLQALWLVDNQWLYLRLIVAEDWIKKKSGDMNSWQMDLSLDGRPYGQRFTADFSGVMTWLGHGDFTKIQLKSVLTPWLMGKGYAVIQDPKLFEGTWNTISGKEQIFQFKIPRSAAYQHEWKINDVDSQLGWHMQLRLLEDNIVFQYPDSNSVIGDVNAMSILEFQAKSSGRYTIFIED